MDQSEAKTGGEKVREYTLEGFSGAVADMIESIAVIRETMPAARESLAILRAEFGRIETRLGQVRRVLPDLFALTDLLPYLIRVTTELSKPSPEVSK